MKRFTLSLIALLGLAGVASAQNQTAPLAQAAPASGTVTASSQNGITADQWKELRVARSSVIQNHPELLAENRALMEKMQAFQVKLTAAMIKTDPSVEPIVAKFQAQKTDNKSANTASAPSAIPAPAAVPPAGK